jgi:prevent-host-death family protein
MAMDDWTVAEAKAKLSEVIERAMSGQPQTITRHGKTAVVVVAADTWKRQTARKGNLADFFASSPLRAIDLETPRLSGRLRHVDVG